MVFIRLWLGFGFDRTFAYAAQAGDAAVAALDSQSAQADVSVWAQVYTAVSHIAR